MGSPATSTESPVPGPSTGRKSHRAPRKKVVPVQPLEEEQLANRLWECFGQLKKVNAEIRQFDLWVKGHRRRLMQRRAHWDGKFNDAASDYWDI